MKNLYYVIIYIYLKQTVYILKFLDRYQLVFFLHSNRFLWIIIWDWNSCLILRWFYRLYGTSSQVVHWATWRNRAPKPNEPLHHFRSLFCSSIPFKPALHRVPAANHSRSRGLPHLSVYRSSQLKLRAINKSFQGISSSSVFSSSTLQ